MSWAYSAGVLTSTGGTSGAPDYIDSGVQVAENTVPANAHNDGYVGWINNIEIRIAANSYVYLDDDYQLELRGASFINPNGSGATFSMGFRTTLIFNCTTASTGTACDFPAGSQFIANRQKLNDPNPKIVHKSSVAIDFPNIQPASAPALVDIDGLDICFVSAYAGGSAFVKAYWGNATVQATANLRVFKSPGASGTMQYYNTTYTAPYLESLALESDTPVNLVTMLSPTFWLATPAAFTGALQGAYFLLRNPTFGNACWTGALSITNTALLATTELDVVYTLAQTYKSVTTALPGVSVRYYRAVASSTGSPAWSAPANAVIDEPTDANGVAGPIDLLDAYHLGTGLTTLERYGWTCKARAYGYRTPGETVFGSRVMYQPTVDLSAGYAEEVQMLAVANLQLSAAQAAALTGISLVNDSRLRTEWDFSEGSGSATADVGSTGNTGTLSAATWTASGRTGNAVSFNGTSSVVSGAAAAVATNSSFSVSAWVYLSAKGAYRTAVSQDGTNISGFFLQYANSPVDRWSFTMFASDSTGAAFYRAFSVASPILNTWYHLLGVYDSIGQTVTLYVNGALGATTAFTSPWSATGVLRVGRAQFGGSTDFFPGVIDEVRLYQRALSSSDAAGLAGVQLPADTTNGTVTITGSRTVSELWAYYRWWISQPVNFGTQDTWSFDGAKLNLGAWNIVVNGATLMGKITTTGTVTGTGAYVTRQVRRWWPP